MLYMSQIVLSAPRRRDLEIANSYRLHQLLWEAFDNGNYEQERDFLFRLDTEPHHSQILVQSQREPDWGKNFAANEWEVKAYQPQFREEQSFYFYLRANAVISQKTNDGSRSVKRPLLAEEYMNWVSYDNQGKIESMEPDRGWLFRQADQHGFSIVNAQVLGPAQASGTKSKKRSRMMDQKNLIQHNGYNLQGTLKVVDAEAFLKMYVKGLGRAKAFGFGLLSLIKV